MCWTTEKPAATDADTVAIGVFQGEEAPAGAPVQVGELLASGEARGSFKSLALTHADGRRWLMVGLGNRDEFTPERARVAAATARERTREISTKVLCWQLPGSGDGEVAAALVQGTMLADYSFDSHKSAKGNPDPEAKPKRLEGLVLTGDGDLGAIVGDAKIVTEAVNEARDLQNRPANDLTPTALAEHARRLGSEIEHLSVEVEGREDILKRSMGAFAAVAQGTDEEPALITLRYEPPGAGGPLLGFVGKAVTFDSGGISLKPGAKMAEMKFDMSGGSAVIGAIAAIARIGLPVRIVAVVGATENLPSGGSVKPGDIVTASNGRTIEVNNTDAEGRLVLADVLWYVVQKFKPKFMVDLATLTGAIMVALGTEYAGMFSNNDELAERLSKVGLETGERVWRMPLGPEYDKQIDSQFADMKNTGTRNGGSITAAQFLQRFVDGTPWAHLDIAGTAMGAPKTEINQSWGSGYGVRLLERLVAEYYEGKK